MAIVSEQLVIDEHNFHEHFFDVRTNGPKKGQVMAKFSAVAEFVSGRGKTDIINLLKMDKAKEASMVMRKIHGAREPDCYRICREICEDLLTMTEEEIEKKAYQYILEYFYYTEKENVPKNDPHWETIQLMSWDTDAGMYKSRIEI